MFQLVLLLAAEEWFGLMCRGSTFKGPDSATFVTCLSCILWWSNFPLSNFPVSEFQQDFVPDVTHMILNKYKSGAKVVES